MKPYWTDGERTIYYGDCREVLPQLKGTGVITDPPYELGFMGKDWDKQGISFQKETWQIIRASCLPGAMLLSFGGTRTFHRIAVAIEDAGFELRDTIMWLYGQGFPKSLDISKAIDKHGGQHTEYTEFAEYIKTKREEKGLTLKQLNETFGFVAGCNWWEAKNSNNFRVPNNEDYPKLKQLLDLDNRFDYLVGAVGEKIGEDIRGNAGFSNEQVPRPWKEKIGEQYDLTAPATPEAQLWEGYGTALKPAYEPILVCMNPLDGTFANNALKHGVAGLNIDGCRIEGQPETTRFDPQKHNHEGWRMNHNGEQTANTAVTKSGRFPANIIHDGSEEVLKLFPDSKGFSSGGTKGAGYRTEYVNGENKHKTLLANTFNDSGSAARFFYCAKSSKSERNAGCENMYWLNGKPTTQEIWESLNKENEDNKDNLAFKRHSIGRGNIHPTVKDLSLMKYLVKLISPPKDAVIIDPFMGSGSTLVACQELGIKCIGIETDEYACEIAIKRLSRSHQYGLMEVLSCKKETLKII